MGFEVSGDWLQSTSTGFLFLVLAGWLVYGIRRAQREALWYDGAREWARLGSVTAQSTGWLLDAGAYTARCRAGLAGVHTRVVRGDEVQTLEGIASVERLAQLTWSSRAD